MTSTPHAASGPRDTAWAGRSPSIPPTPCRTGSRPPPASTAAGWCGTTTRARTACWPTARQRYLFAIAQDDDAEAPDDKTALRTALDAANRDGKVEVYAGDHGWTVPDSPAYAEAAAKRAYADKMALYSAALA